LTAFFLHNLTAAARRKQTMTPMLVQVSRRNNCHVQCGVRAVTQALASPLQSQKLGLREACTRACHSSQHCLKQLTQQQLKELEHMDAALHVWSTTQKTQDDNTAIT
jgi:hypothetical protein